DWSSDVCSPDLPPYRTRAVQQLIKGLAWGPPTARAVWAALESPITATAAPTSTTSLPATSSHRHRRPVRRRTPRPHAAAGAEAGRRSRAPPRARRRHRRLARRLPPRPGDHAERPRWPLARWWSRRGRRGADLARRPRGVEAPRGSPA